MDVYGKIHDVYVARRPPNESEGPNEVIVLDGLSVATCSGPRFDT
jgi:hypothetical protein